MELNKKVLLPIAKAMNYTYSNYLPDYHANVSTISRNGLHGGVWARRAEMIYNSFKNSNDIEDIHIDRKIWDFEAVFDKANNKLYLMMTEKNLQLCKKKYLRSGFSTHYVFSFLHYNEKPNTEVTLFESLTDEQRQYRIDDSEKMLSECAHSVDQVIICAFNEINGSVTQATAYLFDSSFNEVESEDISDLLINNNNSENTIVVSGKTDDYIETPIEMTFRIKTRSQQEKELKNNNNNSN